MSPDVTLIIFQHLSIQEISSVSQVCKATFAASRNPDLWKMKFRSRWNFRVSGNDVDWFLTFVSAYRHCHDLWVTHWNVVYPCDALSPGRCCIQRHDTFSDKTEDKKFSSQQTLSPFHRFDDPKEACNIPDVVETRAQAIGVATALRLRQHSELNITEYSSKRARRTFSRSSTMDRRISAQQFDVQSLSFLTDVLFFNVHSNPDELLQLEERFSKSEPIDIDDSEKCLHSWHLVHFSNPDFNKPMRWRVAVQRPDCFTVYPSEGYLQPGESQVVVFGVTPSASLLVQSKFQLVSECINLDTHSGKQEASSSHNMPRNPFQIQYQYVTPIPCNMFHCGRGHRTQLSQQNLHPKLRSIWDDLSASHLGIRTLNISAHVHSSFPLCEFRRNTLFPPFDLSSSCNRLHLFCAPRLMYLDPTSWRDLENISMEVEESVRGKIYRTEGPCTNSGLFWGERLEELANAFVVEKINCEIQKDRRNKKTKLSGELIRMLIDHKEKSLSDETIESAFSVFKKMIMEYQDARWLSRRQFKVFAEWKSVIHQISKETGNDSPSLALEDTPTQSEVRQSKGAKRQLDLTSGERYASFMDGFEGNPIHGLKLAAKIISDPKTVASLGVYERIRYPGTLCRRSQIPCLPDLIVPNLRMPKMKLKALIFSRQKLEYFKANNALDLEALCFVDSFCRHHAANHCMNELSPPEFLGCTKPPEPDEISACSKTESEERKDSNNAHTATAPETRGTEEQPRNNAMAVQRNGGHRRIPRLLRLFVYLSTRLGLFAENATNVSPRFIDRRVLISIHWISISWMAVPLVSTLFARYVMLVPSTPVDYSLEGLPFSVENKLRYLTEHECGYAAFAVAIVWLVLGRWIERYTGRSYLRGMLEHQLTIDKSSKSFYVKRFQRWYMRVWDTICPLFLQRLVFLVPWNRRKPNDVMKHAVFWRGLVSLEQQTTFDARKGHSPILLTCGDPKIDIGEESNGCKAFVGILVAFGSFWISSPHILLNAMSIFTTGMSLGVGISLQPMEVGRDELTYRKTGSFLKTVNMTTVVQLSCLVGQMVGSSGGILFLAEFIVTSVSILLGGAGTMSIDTMQSWFTFVFYSTFAAFGYAIGRAAIERGIKQQKHCRSLIFLFVSICLASCAVCIPWEFPVPLIIHRPAIGNRSEQGSIYSAKHLQ
ncbi:unnamed protein product [Cylindrotheca closterium]|uniref:F-box domain-containing protein n=1 Tax=Cylindrotheca closterium TaxID=2856 RepID=A0AAD2CUF2_9STRA|nr:unnamed protein product [Cylindrotheca closterium]